MIRFSHIAAPVVVAAALFIGGCTHDRSDEIPASATELTSGTEHITATAPAAGTMYLWDQSANRMLYVGKVDRGDNVRVDAKQNKIYINDRVMTKRDDLTNDHHYKAFFERSDQMRDRDGRLHNANSDRAGVSGSTDLGTDGTTVREERTTTITRDPNAVDRTTVTDPAAGSTTIRKETVVKERTSN